MDNELYHHGVLGMKWGVRRYQNADGSLTKAGKKRAAKIKDEYTALTGKQLRRNPSTSKSNKSSPSGKEDTQPKKKSIKDLSDEELRERTKRLIAEKDYIDLTRQMSDLKPKEVSKGKAFVDTVAKDMLLPAATDVGKQVAKSLMTSAVNKALNLDGDLKVYTNNKKK